MEVENQIKGELTEEGRQAPPYSRAYAEEYSPWDCCSRQLRLLVLQMIRPAQAMVHQSG